MLIDRKHIGWLVSAAIIAACATGLYLWDAPRHPGGPGGDTVLGLTLGGVAMAMMLLLVGLGFKRRVPHWRLGPAATWLRGHIWMGVLVPLLVAYHGAFHAGGPLTIALWLLLGVVTISGLVGLLLQHVVPTLILHSVPGETVAQQLGRELETLFELAEGQTETTAGQVKVVTSGIVLDYTGVAMDRPVPAFTGDDPMEQTEVARLTAVNKPVPGGEPLRRFYFEHARPFLQGRSGALLGKLTRSESMFESLRLSTPTHVHPGVNALESLCVRRRQLLRQRLLMRLLMAWLLVHVPVSWVLVLLSAMHAIVALRY